MAGIVTHLLSYRKGILPNNLPTGLPVITGNPTEDQTLTAVTSGIADVDGLGTFSYQWLRDNSPISGATSNTYILGDDDVATNITVNVSYTDNRGFFESVTSGAVGPIANINDTPSGVPVVTIQSPGVLEVGAVLESDVSSIADPDGLGTFSYQWLRNGIEISGATSNTYTIQYADGGYSLALKVSWTDQHGTFEYVTSTSAGPVPVPEGSYDITTASVDPDATKDISAQISNENAYLTFNEEGTIAVVVTSNGSAYKYTLSTPWDITTLSYASNTATINSSKGIWMDTSGTRIYYTKNDNNLYQRTLSSAWDLTSIGTELSSNMSSDKIRGVSVSENGVNGLYYEDNGKTIREFTMSTPWLITTTSSTPNSISATGNETFNASRNGKHIYEGKTSLYQRDLSTAWNITTASAATSKTFTHTNIRHVFVGDNGNKLFFVADGIIGSYTLT